jgi:rare lipoprotein A
MLGRAHASIIGFALAAGFVCAGAARAEMASFSRLDATPRSDVAAALTNAMERRNAGGVDLAASRAIAPAADRAALAPHQRLGAPYQRAGLWYMPAHEPNFTEEGLAGVMARDLVGRRSANGETLSAEALTAAHPTLPLPSLLEVTNLDTGRTVTVRLNDRGPFVQDRMLDLSPAAAAAIGVRPGATARVRARYVGAAPSAPLPSAPSAPSQVLVAETAPRAAPSAGATFVQAGAFASQTNAARAATRLSSLAPAEVKASTINGARLYRVVMGPLASRDAAENALPKIAALGLPGARVIAN